MPERRRANDLTADLMHDMVVEEQTYPTEPPPATPSAVLETSLFLSPRRWLRPALERSAGSLAVSAGPLRVRLRRPR